MNPVYILLALTLLTLAAWGICIYYIRKINNTDESSLRD